MARHHHRPHLSQGTLAIAVVARKPLPANPPNATGSAPLTKWWSIYPTTSEEERSVLDQLSATVFTSGELAEGITVWRV